MTDDLLQQDIQAIIKAGGTDRDVTNYLDSQGIKYTISDQSPQPQQPDRLTVGKAVTQPLSQTLTGKSIQNRLFEPAAQELGVTGHPVQSYIAGLGGDLLSMAESPAALATYGASKIPGVPQLAGKAMGALGQTKAGQAVGSFVNTPVEELAQRGWQAIKNTPKNLGNTFNFDRQGLDLADKIRMAAAEIKQTEVNKFGNTIDQLTKSNPSKTISLDTVIEDLKSNWHNIPPEVRGVLNRTPRLNTMLSGNVNNEINLKEAQDIVNYLNTKVPKNIRYNSLDLLDTVNDIKGAQLEAFPNEMAQARQAYGNFKNNYNLIKNTLRPGSTVNAIKSNFNGNVELQKAAQNIFSPQMISQMGSYRNKIMTAQLIKRLMKWGIGGAAAAAVGRGAYKAITGEHSH